ncbi:Gfo/Idh/MocA family oxidoreductase [Diaminobutyricimonas sp. TR449]|uniref:Gfo/Idh/MocA family protein n=1 Tax=Diaminobutyricimonas sp. TR449 TaxID=2708076 RepID=UPI00141FF94B|nr:Gfo/Idh/MocA family oxidoreductase [Diaminobutyricimonas sp. TR449]
MTTDVIGAGLIGGGFMGQVHSHAARVARADVIGVASRSAESAKRAAGDLGIATAFESIDALVQDAAVDIVHVCSPNVTHTEYALAVLDAGKHVICEKPLATTVADATRLADRAVAAGVVAAVPFVYRYHPLVREARARVMSGETGRLLTINGTYLQDWLLGTDATDWRVDPGLGGPSRAFADIGSHLADLVEFVTDDRIARLCAITGRAYDERAGRAVNTEDTVALLVQTTRAAIGTLLISQVAPGRKNALVLEVAGTDESLRFEQENPEVLWLGRRAGSVLLPRDATQTSRDSSRLSMIPAGHPLGYQDAFNAFVADAYAATRGDMPEGMPTFEDGLRAAQITEAVLASAASQAWVDVAPTRHSQEVTA